MAFDTNFDKVLKIQQQKLKELETDMGYAALRLSKASAQMAMASMKAIFRSPVIHAMISRMSSAIIDGVKVSGKGAAKAFRQAFQSQTLQTMGTFNQLAAAVTDVERRTERLSEDMTSGWTKSAAAARLVLRAEKEEAKQLELNQQLLKKLAHQKGVLTKQGVAKKDPRYQALVRSGEEIKAQAAEMRRTIKSAEKLGVAVRQLEIQETFRGWQQKVFGNINGFFGKLKMGWDMAKMALTKPMMLLGLLGGGLFLLLKSLWDAYSASARVFRDSGLTATQTIHQVGRAAEVATASLGRGMVISQELAAQSVSALSDELGHLNVSHDLANEVGYLAGMFKLSAAQVAGLAGALLRLNKGDNKKTVGQLEEITHFAASEGLNVANVLKMVADNADDIAQSGQVSAIAFAKAAVASKQMGVNVSRVTQLATGIVSDFEGALMSQAKLQTFAPGVDMSRYFLESQFGNQEQVLESLKGIGQQLANRYGDFDNIPLSLKQGMSDAMKLSIPELQKFMFPLENKDKPVELTKTEAALTSLLDATVGSDGILATLQNILAALFPLGKIMHPWETFKEWFKSTPDVKSQVPGHKGEVLIKGQKYIPEWQRQGDTVAKKYAPTPIAPPIIQASTEKGSLGAAIVARSTQVSPPQASKLSAPQVALKAPPAKSLTAEKTESTKTTSEGAEVAAVDTTRIESLLQQLVQSSQKGGAVYMDAMKVGTALKVSHRGR